MGLLSRPHFILLNSCNAAESLISQVHTLVVGLYSSTLFNRVSKHEPRTPSVLFNVSESVLCLSVAWLGTVPIWNNYLPPNHIFFFGVCLQDSPSFRCLLIKTAYVLAAKRHPNGLTTSSHILFSWSIIITYFPLQF